MKEIEKKLLEIWELLGKIPDECKGPDRTATENRHRFLDIRSAIRKLIDKQ